MLIPSKPGGLSAPTASAPYLRGWLLLQDKRLTR